MPTPGSLIQIRLENSLKIHSHKAQYDRDRNPNIKRRASYKREATARRMVKHLSFLADEVLHKRLTDFCEHHKVARGIVLRDALDFYLGIAEQECLHKVKPKKSSKAKHNHNAYMRKWHARKRAKREAERAEQRRQQEEEAGASEQGREGERAPEAHLQ